MDPKSRADYGKAHVIISEKKDKKAAKYMVKDLPYPYTSKAQFEKSLDTPIGPEWNTRVGFQRGTLPKITKKVCCPSEFFFLRISISMSSLTLCGDRWALSSIPWRSYTEHRIAHLYISLGFTHTQLDISFMVMNMMRTLLRSLHLAGA